ncbi:MAG: hypothetical protein KA973_14280 [Candidatus Microthrix sp.]|nr:hypothetical protein [Candidatus Microthrix sp.]
MLDWLEQNPEMVEGVSTAFGALGNMMRWFWNNILLPVVKFWIHSNAEVVKGLGLILEATGRMTGNKDLENFGKGIQTAATATQEWADGLKAIPDEVSPTVAINDQAAAKIKSISEKIQGLKGKIVEAKAKGDTKEIDRLRDRIKALKGKKVEVIAHVRKTGVTSISLAKGGGRNDLDVRLKYRMGGRPRVGEIAQFHKDEFWVPDTAGTVISQQRSRSLMGSGPGAVASTATGVGGTVINLTVNGPADTVGAAKVMVSALNGLSLSSGGKGFNIREGVRK